MVTAKDVPGSKVDEAPTDGTLDALVADGLVPAACIHTSTIATGTRTAVGTDVSQPLSSSGSMDVTETVIIEADVKNAALDISEATSGARFCPATQEDVSGKFGDQSVSTAGVTMGAWTGTRTTALNTYASGVSRVASYVYFLIADQGLLLMQLGVAFANAAPAAQYQQRADRLAATLTKRLGAVV